MKQQQKHWNAQAEYISIALSVSCIKQVFAPNESQTIRYHITYIKQKILRVKYTQTQTHKFMLQQNLVGRNRETQMLQIKKKSPQTSPHVIYHN